MTGNQFTELDRLFKSLYRINQKWFGVRTKMSREVPDEEAEILLRKMANVRLIEIEGILDSYTGAGER